MTILWLFGRFDNKWIGNADRGIRATSAKSGGHSISSCKLVEHKAGRCNTSVVRESADALVPKREGHCLSTQQRACGAHRECRFQCNLAAHGCIDGTGIGECRWQWSDDRCLCLCGLVAVPVII